jgi:hypothetical protein
VLSSSKAAGQYTLTIVTQKGVLGVLCASVLGVILTAGLWPFHAPKNQVSWLSNGNGLHFGDHGVILSTDAFNLVNLKSGTPCSVEIRLQPAVIYTGGTILAFYTPGNHSVPFSLHQSLDDLVLRREFVDREPRAKPIKLYIEHIFRPEKEVIITIAAGEQSIAVYVNGALVKTSTRFALSSKELTGQLVVGNSPVADDGWQGQLRGLTIYNQELTAAEALQHYDAWTTKGLPEIKKEGPVALYFFDERIGSVVHNQMNSGTDLHIPERFSVLHAPFLEPPWDEFRPSWGYCKNVLVNIGGFVPLGFFFCAYFSSVQRLSRAMLATIVLGGVVSLTIEVLQAFLPTRESGITDIITNTLGTGIGATLYNHRLVQVLFASVAQRRSVGESYAGRQTG